MEVEPFGNAADGLEGPLDLLGCRAWGWRQRFAVGAGQSFQGFGSQGLDGVRQKKLMQGKKDRHPLCMVCTSLCKAAFFSYLPRFRKNLAYCIQRTPWLI